jgi:hypothetical protein
MKLTGLAKAPQVTGGISTYGPTGDLAASQPRLMRYLVRPLILRFLVRRFEWRHPQAWAGFAPGRWSLAFRLGPHSVRLCLLVMHRPEAP